MQKHLPSPPTMLFTLRLWRESLDDQQDEWRGEVRNIATGEARYFRRWEEIATQIQKMLDEEPL